jgi:enolase
VSTIEAVGAREILDSRGNPTVEVEVALDDGTLTRAAVPSGASTGAYEAVELRDGDAARYGGKGVQQAVNAVLDVIGQELLGIEATEQRIVDQVLIDLDGTPDKSRLGANAMLGVSLAVAKAAADSSGLPLFRYLGGPNAHLLPVPMLNILNGGAHADSNVDVQEFMIAPDRRGELRGGPALGRADLPRAQEGAQGPRPRDRRRRRGRLRAEPAEQPRRARPHPRGDRQRGLHAGTDIALALDVAASEFHEGGAYRFEGGSKTSDEMIEYYAGLVDAYPMVSIEDPLDESDWDGWERMTTALGSRVQLVGDDLFVTNPQRLADGIARGCANALLVKVNQIGTLTETLDAVHLAHRSGSAA